MPGKDDEDDEIIILDSDSSLDGEVSESEEDDSSEDENPGPAPAPKTLVIPPRNIPPQPANPGVTTTKKPLQDNSSHKSPLRTSIRDSSRRQNDSVHESASGYNFGRVSPPPPRASVSERSNGRISPKKPPTPKKDPKLTYRTTPNVKILSASEDEDDSDCMIVDAPSPPPEPNREPTPVVVQVVPKKAAPPPRIEHKSSSLLETVQERKKRQKLFLEEQQKRKEAAEEEDRKRLMERRNTRRQLDQQRYQRPTYHQQTSPVYSYSPEPMDYWEGREFQQNRLSPVIARNPARSPPHRPRYRQEDRYAPSPRRFVDLPHEPSSSRYRRSKSPEYGIHPIHPERYQERYPLPMRPPSPTRYNPSPPSSRRSFYEVPERYGYDDRDVHRERYRQEEPYAYQERYPMERPLERPEDHGYGYRRDPECSRAPRHHEHLRYTPYNRPESESRGSRRSSEDRQLAPYDDRRMNSPRRRQDYRDPPTTSGFRRDRSRERMEHELDNRASRLNTRRNDRFSEEPRICVMLDPENFDYDRPLSPPRPELFNDPPNNNRFLPVRIKDEPMEQHSESEDKDSDDDVQVVWEKPKPRMEHKPQHMFFPTKKELGPPPDGIHFDFPVSDNYAKQPFLKGMSELVRHALPELSLRANCQMEMLEEFEGRSWRCIKLVGSPEQVLNAQKSINNWLLDWQEADDANYPNNPVKNRGNLFVDIPEVARRALFGNRFRMLNRIQGDNKVIIDKCQSVETGPPIFIRGDLENVRQAYYDVMDVIEKAIEEDENAERATLQVPREAAGAIMGRRGMNIRKIADASTAKIRMLPDTDPTTTFRIIEVTGDPDEIQKVMDEIQKHVDASGPCPSDEGVFEQHVPDHKVGQLIGREGCRLNFIEEQSGAKCRIFPDPEGNGQKAVCFGGLVEADYARHMVRVILGETDRNTPFERTGSDNKSKVHMVERQHPLEYYRNHRLNGKIPRMY